VAGKEQPEPPIFLSLSLVTGKKARDSVDRVATELEESSTSHGGTPPEIPPRARQARARPRRTGTNNPPVNYRPRKKTRWRESSPATNCMGVPPSPGAEGVGEGVEEEQ
jgi:hypothetical protein